LSEQHEGSMTTENVLRTRRLEIVDDSGKVRAVLGTGENDVTDLSMFDASGKVRAALEVGEVPGEASGLRLFDTNGETRVSLYSDNDPDKGVVLSITGAQEKTGAALGVDDAGQSWLTVSAGEKGRSIKAAVDANDEALLLFTGEGPIIALGTFNMEGQDFPSLVLADEQERGGMVLNGSRYTPSVRFMDPAGEVSAGIELKPNGKLMMASYDRNKPLSFLWAFVFCFLIIGGAAIGVWAASALFDTTDGAGLGPGFLPVMAGAALTSLIIAGLGILLDYLRR